MPRRIPAPVLVATLCGALVVTGYVARQWTARVWVSLTEYQSPYRPGAASPVTASPVAAPPTTALAPVTAVKAPVARRVVLVLVDGLREDASRGLPFLDSLRARGADLHSRANVPSLSYPGRASLHAGAWQAVHGQTTNFNPRPIAVDHLFASVARTGRVAALASWPETHLLFGDAHRRISYDYAHHEPVGDGLEALQRDQQDAIGKALALLADSAVAFLEVDLTATDEVAHHWGAASAEYRRAALAADSGIRRVAAALDPARDVLIVTADHGHRDAGGHGGPEPEVLAVPWVMAGAGVRAGAKGDAAQIDVAPTVAILLGAPIPEQAAGTPVLDALTLDSAARADAWRTVRAQRERALHVLRPVMAVADSIGDRCVDADSACVAAWDGAVRTAAAALASTERGARLPSALLVILAPLILLALAWRAGVVPGREVVEAGIGLAVTAIAYAVAFRPAGLGYSFSAIQKEAELGAFFTRAMAVAVACTLVGVLVVTWRRRTERAAITVHAGRALGVVAATLYGFGVAAVATHANVGVLMRWMVPDVTWAFGFYLDALSVMALGFAAPAFAVVAIAVRWVIDRRRGTAAVVLAMVGGLAAAACTGSTEPPSVASVALTPGNTTLLIGPGGSQSLQFTATPQAGNGKPLATRPVIWASSSLGVASVSATGLVTALGIGTATISATSEAKVGSVQVTVQPVPVSTVAIAPGAPSTWTGGTTQLAAEPRDSTGLALAGRPVTWSSGNTAVATVSQNGLVSGITAGTALITATSEGRNGSVTVTVSAPAGPVLSGVTPSPMVPGTTVTLAGTGFEVGGVNMLTLRGQAVAVQSVSATELTFRVPCVSSGAAPLQVTTSAGPGPVLAATVAVTQRALAVGQSLVITDQAGAECNELPATGGSARYLIAAFSMATSANTLIDLELGGNTAVGAGWSAGANAAAPAPGGRVGRARADLARLLPRGPQVARDAEHTRHLERERALYERLRAEGAHRLPKRAVGARLVAPPAVGEIRRMFYNRTSCADSTQIIRARAVHVGTYAVVWEDSANALATPTTPEMAAWYQRIGELFDRDQYAAVRQYFGDPLRRDPLTDDDGRLHMVFTQRLNGSGAAAYVTSCDMVPRNETTRAASNFGEYFYGTVPTTVAPNVNSTASPDGWYAFMSRTVVHEVKHIASLSARFANNAPTFESSWLEEGTARHAEEVWVRDSLHRVAWKGNTGYGTAATNGVYCDFNLANATCVAADAFRRPTWGLRRQLNEILPKLADPADWSPFGDGSGQSGSVFYNTTWSLVRWASDRYGVSDSAFLTALTQSSTNGLANLAAVTGAPAEHLIGAWGLALLADDLPGLAAPSLDVRFPTWNLRDIYGALHADPAWASRFTTPYPVTATVLSLGSFTSGRSGVRGGAHQFFDLSGAHTVPQLLHLRGPGGAPLPTAARLAILRVQ